MKKIQIWGAIFVIVAGTALHFLFESTNNILFALFSPVNESVWEHLKLVFYPFLIYGVFEYFVYGRNKNNFIPVRLLSIIFAMLMVIIGHYTYSGVIGKSYEWIDILIFVLSVIGGYILSNALFKTERFSSKSSNLWSVLLVFLLILCFSVWTYYPPSIAIFRDPETNSTGISILTEKIEKN